MTLCLTENRSAGGSHGLQLNHDLWEEDVVFTNIPMSAVSFQGCNFVRNILDLFFAGDFLHFIRMVNQSPLNEKSTLLG